MSDDAWRPPQPSAPGPSATALLPGLDGAVEVARGSDSIVYRARQVALDRDVAVKVLQVDDPATVARFRRELDITVRLGRLHPHIVTVLDTGVTSDGRPAIVMEYLERGSLHDALKATGPLPSQDVVRVGKVIADALAFAHGQGVLHRDVKPQNILVLPTSWVLADFGISRLVDSGATASVEQFSYRHASPQVLDGREPSAADDIWSLGSTLFTLLDGRPPFADDDPADDTALAYLRRARTEPPRPLRRGDLAPGLEEVVARCLEKDPAARPESAEALLHALSRVEGASGIWAPTIGGSPAAGATPSPAMPAEAPPAAAPSVPDPMPESTPSPADAAASEAAPSKGAPADAERSGTGSVRAAPDHRPAISALAHTRPTAPDAEPTGAAPDAGGAGPAGPPTSVVLPVEPAGPRRGLLGTPGRRVALGLVAGVAVGVALVVIGTGRDEPLVAAPTPSVNTVPTALPSASATPVPPVQDPRIRPVVVDARGRGTSVALEWTDPSDGTAVFIVTQVGLAEPRVVAQFGRGSTSGVVEGVDPDADEVCYVIGAITADSSAASTERCLDPSP